MSQESRKVRTVKICEDITNNGVEVTLDSYYPDTNKLHLVCGFPFDDELAESLIKTIEIELRRAGIACTHSKLIPNGEPDKNLEHHTVITGMPAEACKEHRLFDLVLKAVQEADMTHFAGTLLGKDLEHDPKPKEEIDREELRRHYWSVLSRVWPRSPQQFFGEANGQVPPSLVRDEDFIDLRRQMLEDATKIAVRHHIKPDFDIQEVIKRCVSTHLCEWDFVPEKTEAITALVASRAVSSLDRDSGRSRGNER
jgi:hypothetical protein